jgi:heme/copper-type cytochrome/quinol oxidase subunit 3
MDYAYQENKKKIYLLKYIVFEIFIFSIRFTKYFLSVNTNSEH